MDLQTSSVHNVSIHHLFPFYEPSVAPAYLWPLVVGGCSHRTQTSDLQTLVHVSRFMTSCPPVSSWLAAVNLCKHSVAFGHCPCLVCGLGASQRKETVSNKREVSWLELFCFVLFFHHVWSCGCSSVTTLKSIMFHRRMEVIHSSQILLKNTVNI